MARLVVRILCGKEWGPVPWQVGYGKMRVLCGAGKGLRRGARARRRWPAPGDLVRGGGARAGASGVGASRACGLGHHQCGAGHPARLPLFRMVSSKAGAGSAPGAVGGEWRHTNERW